MNRLIAIVVIGLASVTVSSLAAQADEESPLGGCNPPDVPPPTKSESRS